MHLLQVGLIRVPFDAAAVFHLLPAVDVPFHTQARQQANARFIGFAKGIGAGTNYDPLSNPRFEALRSR